MSTPWSFGVSLATGQQFLQGQYRRWVQVHLQGPRRAVFRGWQQVAARRRHTVARSEQRLLQRWVGGWGSPSPPEKQGGCSGDKRLGCLCSSRGVQAGGPGPRKLGGMKGDPSLEP